eukprot:2965193-Prymnesium_polylepis.3
MQINSPFSLLAPLPPPLPPLPSPPPPPSPSFPCPTVAALVGTGAAVAPEASALASPPPLARAVGAWRDAAAMCKAAHSMRPTGDGWTSS